MQLGDQTHRSLPTSPVQEAIPVPSSPPARTALRYTNRGRREDRRTQRGFRRYRAWEEAIRRNREQTPLVERPSLDVAIDRASYQPSQQPIGHGRPYDNFDPGAHPSGASGTSSNPNGHGVQRPAYDAPSSLHSSSPYYGRIAESQASYEQVGSVVPFPASTSSREMTSSASSHFQDTVLRSIEPVSPIAQPAFIRTIPPRSQVAVSPYAATHAPVADYQQAARLVSHPEEGAHAWDRPPAAHVTVGFNRHPETMDVDPISSRESVNSHDFRGHTYPHSTGYGAQPASSLSYPVSVNPGPSSSSRLPEMRRIVLNATRPGERSNPILMEDRGGYYERINPRPEGSARIQLRATRPAQPRAEVEVQATVRPQAIFSWEEDLRNRGARRGVAEIEIRPVFDPRLHAPPTHPYPPHHDHYGAPRVETLTKEEDYRVQSRQVHSGEYAAPPPEGYWVM